MMKLILTQEVAGLGGPGEVVEVKNGYGRNYLVPQGLAFQWTKGSQKQIDSIRRAREVREIRDLGYAEEVKGQLEKLTVRVPARSGASGRLFGAVTVAEISAAVKKAGGPDVDKRRIQIANPIKSTGTHVVSVRVHEDVTAKLAVDVVPA